MCAIDQVDASDILRLPNINTIGNLVYVILSDLRLLLKVRGRKAVVIADI